MKTNIALVLFLVLVIIGIRTNVQQSREISKMKLIINGLTYSVNNIAKAVKFMGPQGPKFINQPYQGHSWSTYEQSI